MSEKMNVLFFITDQQRADHLGCAGNEEIKTPNLDELANEGVRFTNAYCANPMCMPNRATIFTGKYPSIHGVRSNGINLNKSIPTITQTLLDHNYQTYSIGKVHLNFFGNPYSRNSHSEEALIPSIYIPSDKKPPHPNPYYGFDEVDMVIGHGDAVGGDYIDWVEERAPEYHELIKQKAPRLFDKIMDDSPIPEEIYHTSYITDKAISFLERFSEGEYGDRSFFIHCSYPDPHLPVCPPGRYKKMYDPNELKIPSNLKDVEKLYEHKVLGPFINVYRPNWLRETTENELRQFLAYTYGTISMIDSSVGKILAALNSFDLERDTMVIFTSDHGDLMGDHGLLLKGPAHYNGVLNVPLIWKVPNLTMPGSIVNSLVNSIDIPMTILELLNIKEKYRPGGMQGKDITPLLKDPENEVRDCCIIEEDEPSQKDSHNLPSLRVRTMVTDTYRLTVYQDYEDYGELYNLKKDPQETNNLWEKPKYSDIKEKLMKKFLHELIKLQPHYPHKQARS
jgi:arylsulfatase A-like enzyme